MKHLARVLIVGMVCVLWVGMPVEATYVTSIQLVIDPGDYIYKDDAFRLLDADGSSPAALLSGDMKVFGASSFGYKLVNTTVTMGSQSTLNLDASGPGGAFNPFLAKGYFDAGATMSISGTIEKRGPLETDPTTPIFTGVILEAFISETSDSDFLARERNLFDGGLANQVKSNHAMTVTGGELWQDKPAKETTLVLLDFRAKYDVMNSLQADGVGWGDVEDFQTDIIVGPGSRVHFDAIPEPASLILLGLGSLLIRRKKSN